MLLASDRWHKISKFENIIEVTLSWSKRVQLQCIESQQKCNGCLHVSLLTQVHVYVSIDSHQYCSPEPSCKTQLSQSVCLSRCFTQWKIFTRGTSTQFHYQNLLTNCLFRLSTNYRVSIAVAGIFLSDWEIGAASLSWVCDICDSYLQTLSVLKRAHEVINKHRGTSCNLKAAKYQLKSFNKVQPKIEVSLVWLVF